MGGVLVEARLCGDALADIGAVDGANDKILEWTRSNEACILTVDLDFGEMLAMTGGSAPSVVQIRARRRKVDLVGDRVVGALVQMRDEIALGALVTIDISRTRIRLLPLLERRNNG